MVWDLLRVHSITSSVIVALFFLCILTLTCESLRFPVLQSTSRGYLSTLKGGKFIYRSALEVSSKEEYGDEYSSLYRRIEDAFNQKMKSTQVPLFESFPTYIKSLPVRYSVLTRSYIRLCTLDYIVRPEDLRNMTSQILKPSARIARNEVRYLSAPTASGKTSSVLPAFLESASMEDGGTHYLYIACNNNDKRRFRAEPLITSSDIVAERQGAAFMVQCVKNLLERPDDAKAYRIRVPGTVFQFLLKNTVEDYVKDLEQFLREKLGDNARVWFHVDEHRKMCDRSPDSRGGAAFSRGAMQVLAMVDKAIVVATYTGRPDIPAAQSSEVCRIPIALPPIDVNQVMSGVVPELRVDSTDFSTEERRLLASLKVRLGLKIKAMNIISILHKRGTDARAEVYLNDFQEAMQGSDRVQALKDCIALCGVDIPLSTESDPDAARLLLSIPDDDKSDWLNSRKFSDVSVLPNGRISLSVEGLLGINNGPSLPIYKVGRSQFRKCLVNVADEPDLLSSTPLEAAYQWTLSCRSALEGDVEFGLSSIYSIQCTALKPARIFPFTNSSVYDLSFLQPNVMYYAKEKTAGLPTHPLADIFFITKEQELVLVDIAGGSIGSVREKAKRLSGWIRTEQNNITEYKLQGVVLAPNVRGLATSDYSDVTITSGDGASTLLGGLSQILQWLD